MTGTTRSIIIVFAGTLAGFAGCRQSPDLYWQPSYQGAEACPSQDYPSDDHPPAPPQVYFRGPLTPKTLAPVVAAPAVAAPAEPAGVNQEPEGRLESLEPPPQEGAAPEEDDSTAALRTAHGQLHASRHSGRPSVGH